VTGRHWRMSLPPATVLIESTLDLGRALDGLRRSGESALYTLEPCGRDDTAYGRAARVVHVNESTSTGAWYDADRRVLRLCADDGDLTGPRLLYLSYLVLEAELHRLGFVTLHAAAAARDGRAVLLLGSAGAGKTTTALRLCCDHGCELVGNDLVVVGGQGGVAAVVGTAHLRLRHSSIAQVLPELLGLFPPVVADPWRTKVDVTPDQVGVSVSRDVAEIAAVVFVHVDTGYPSVVTDHGDSLVHRLNLYENALRYIRAASTPWLLDDSGRYGPFVPSFDDPLAHAARTATLTCLLARSAYVAGPPATVAAHIAGLLPTGPAIMPDARRPQWQPLLQS